MRGVWEWGVKTLLQLANFALGPDATLNTEIHKNSVRIKAPDIVNALKLYEEAAIESEARSTVVQLKSKA